jgi:hypothetical protein
VFGRIPGLIQDVIEATVPDGALDGSLGVF